jgi:hypothetical protein
MKETLGKNGSRTSRIMIFLVEAGVFYFAIQVLVHSSHDTVRMADGALPQAIALVLNLLDTEPLSRADYAAHIAITFAMYLSVSINHRKRQSLLLELLTDNIPCHRRPNGLIQPLPRK